MIWRACERMHIIPPDCKERWDDMTETHQAMILAYCQIREHEEAKFEGEKMKIVAASGRML